MLGFSIPAPA